MCGIRASQSKEGFALPAAGLERRVRRAGRLGTLDPLPERRRASVEKHVGRKDGVENTGESNRKDQGKKTRGTFHEVLHFGGRRFADALHRGSRRPAIHGLAECA